MGVENEATKGTETKLQKSCDHIWERGQTYVVDPDGWYYNQPTHRVIFHCSKCGFRKEVDI